MVSNYFQTAATIYNRVEASLSAANLALTVQAASSEAALAISGRSKLEPLTIRSIHGALFREVGGCISDASRVALRECLDSKSWRAAKGHAEDCNFMETISFATNSYLAFFTCVVSLIFKHICSCVPKRADGLESLSSRTSEVTAVILWPCELDSQLDWLGGTARRFTMEIAGHGRSVRIIRIICKSANGFQ